ncbi:MAG: T9SS type A sorting domain-containing protein [Flavobacteriales bacterium]
MLLASSRSMAVTVQIQVQNYPVCVYPTGALYALANGGVGPYSYQWSTGATTNFIEGLPPGTYSVTVTDFNSDQATSEVTLQGEPLQSPWTFWLPGCPADNSGMPTKRLFCMYTLSSLGMGFWDQGGLVGPSDEYFYVGAFGQNSSGPYTTTITDANGCTTTINDIIRPDPIWPIPQVLSVDGSCSGGANGSINVYVPSNSSPSWTTGLRLYRDGVQFPWANGQSGGANGYSTIPSTGINLTATGLPSGTYHLVSMIDWGDLNDLLESDFIGLTGTCQDTMTLVVPDLGYTCGTLSGRAYIDANENCSQNSGEPALPGTVIEVLPGPFYALTDGSGNYGLNLSYGSYTVNTVNPNYQEHCGVSTTPFALTAGQPNLTRNLPDTSLAGLDMVMLAASGAARPGFEIAYSLVFRNLVGVLAGTGSVTMTFDPTLIYLSATPAPTSVAGNTITWNTNSIGAFGQRNFSLRFQVPPNINLLGTVLTSTITGSVANPEANLSNNTYVHQVTVTGAYDPNDKTALTSSRESNEIYFINDDEWIDYTIRFQNTGTDTAFFVVITDTLPGTLDPATFQAGVSSHAHALQLLGHGVLRWTFANILLPDSNVNEPRSHGFVSFRIRPRQPVLPGTIIENIANIYFDYNPPVITEPSVLVAEFSTGEQGQAQVPEAMRLMPNPVNDVLFISANGNLASFRITAADGREVMARTVRAASASIAVDQLNAGAYLLIVTFTNGNEARERFIKH